MMFFLIVAIRLFAVNNTMNVPGKEHGYVIVQNPMLWILYIIIMAEKRNWVMGVILGTDNRSAHNNHKGIIVLGSTMTIQSEMRHTL